MTSKRFEMTWNRFEVTSKRVEVIWNRFEVTSRRVEVIRDRLDVTSKRSEIMSRRFEVTSNRTHVLPNRFGVASTRFEPSRIRSDRGPTRSEAAPVRPRPRRRNARSGRFESPAIRRIILIGFAGSGQINSSFAAMRPSDWFILISSVGFFGTAAALLAYFRRSWTDVFASGSILMLCAGMFNRWFAPWPAVILGVFIAVLLIGTLISGLRSRAA